MPITVKQKNSKDKAVLYSADELKNISRYSSLESIFRTLYLFSEFILVPRGLLGSDDDRLQFSITKFHSSEPSSNGFFVCIDIRATIKGHNLMYSDDFFYFPLSFFDGYTLSKFPYAICRYIYSRLCSFIGCSAEVQQQTEA